MTTTDAGEFIRALTVLAEVFGESLSEERQMAYFHALGDLDTDSVKRGLERAVRECRFFPKPAELRELSGTGAPDAGAIMAEILAAKRHAGWEHSAPAVTPLVGLVIARLGGWRRCWDLTDESLWFRVREVAAGAADACRARGLPLEIAATERPRLSGPAMLAAPAPAPEPSTAPASEDPRPLLRAVAEGLQQKARAQESSSLTPEELAARRAALREQARFLGVRS